MIRVVSLAVSQYNTIQPRIFESGTGTCFGHACLKETLSLSWVALRFITQTHDDPFRNLARTPFSSDDTVEDFKLFAESVRLFNTTRVAGAPGPVPAIPVSA